MKFKAKEKQSKDPKLKSVQVQKRIVTKPLPLMYKSKGALGSVHKMSDRLLIPKRGKESKLEKASKKSASEESLLNIDKKEKRKRGRVKKVRSADNSPVRRVGTKTTTNAKKDKSSHTKSDTKNPKRIPLSHYIKKSKASMNKKHSNTLEDDRPFTIDFFEKAPKKTQDKPLSPFHNPYRDPSYAPRQDSPKEDSRPEPARHQPVHGAGNRKGNARRGRGRGRGNVMKRPSQVHHSSPADVEEDIDKIDLSQPLEKVPEDQELTSETC